MSPSMDPGKRGSGQQLTTAARDRLATRPVDRTVTCIACAEPLTMATLARIHPTCEHDPDLAASELFGIIAHHITNQPRSLQTRIGPSELGTPCDRRIGYKMAGTPEVNNRHGVGWKAFIGTAVHEQFANMLAALEVAACNDPGHTPRWFVEERVNVGQVNGTDIDGNCDLFDAWTGNVWDWKFSTRNKIREEYKPHGPGDQYRTQAHTYGRGWARRGMDVRNVGIIFMTRDGEFTDRHVFSEPYDEQIAVTALTRASGIRLALDALGPDFTIPTLPTADAYCGYCPWHKPNSANLAVSCPGHAPKPAVVPTTKDAFR